MRRPARVTQAEIDEGTPLRLSDAAALAFPQGGMTVCGLRREAARGRLAIMRVAGKDYTTLAAIKDMLEKCRVPPKAPDYGFAPPAEIGPAPSSRAPAGSSSTAAGRSAQDAVREKLIALKERSPTISPPNTPRSGASVTFLKSRSPT